MSRYRERQEWIGELDGRTASLYLQKVAEDGKTATAMVHRWPALEYKQTVSLPLDPSFLLPSGGPTLTDLFCGAGGSSSGARVAGVEVRMAANHWKLAVDTHQKNHPDADHDVADISQADPRRYPATDILWASPECTNHSIAKGRRILDRQPDLFGDVLPDEAADRSRATMWDVPRFVEAKILAGRPYKGFVVENVVDVNNWMFYAAWKKAMKDARYCLHEVYLNSMHAQALDDPAPQSRDRWYCVGHLEGTPCPDLEKWTRPMAYCSGCDEVVRAIQHWKNPRRQWGRYRSQYLYRCPQVSCRGRAVEPAWLPAAAAIDWSLKGQRIGDRTKPLAVKTMARIEKGLEKYGRVLMVPVEGREGKTAQPADWSMRTQTARNETGLAVPPFMVELRGGSSDHRPVVDPLSTVTASGNHHGLLVPAGGTWNEDSRPTWEPFRTRTTRENEGLFQWAATYGYDTGQLRSVGDVLPTQTTVEGDALLTADQIPDVDDCYFRMLEPHEIQGAMAFAPEYIVLGNKRERVRQLGNAVTPPAARDLIAALAESLGQEVAA